MTTDKFVVSQKVAERLRDLGYPQEGSLFYWVKYKDKVSENFRHYFSPRICYGGARNSNWENICAAPTVWEMGKMLPALEILKLKMTSSDYLWDFFLEENWYYNSDLVGEIVAFLLENKLVKTEALK